jgi:MFS family permease
MKVNRLAVSSFFFFVGFLYANWVARLPELQRLYGVSNATLGTLLLCWAAGAIVAMPFTGWLSARFGSRTISLITAFAFCFFAPVIPVFSNVWLIGSLFFILGLNNGALDVTINGQAVYVERMYNKPIMSSFHALFSIGMALGAGSGALFAEFEIPLFSHLLIVSAIGLVLLVWASQYLIKDEPNNSRNTDGSSRDSREGVSKSGSTFQLPTKAILPLGIVAFCGMTGEGSTADWSAIYMHKTVGMSEAFSALAFGSFATAMTIGRIFGDLVITELGKRKVLIYSSLLCIFGLSLALVLPSAYVVLAGLFSVGLGLANVVPIVYSTAGNTEGVTPSVGIAMATTIGYTGFFIGPPVIGFLADIFSLQIGLVFTLILFIIMLFLVYKKQF